MPVLVVDPACTSQRCLVCWYTQRENRKTQAGFVRLACGHSENADVNAAKNIAFRNQPNALRFQNESMEEIEGQTPGHEQ